jgi:hypothetical protein
VRMGGRRQPGRARTDGGVEASQCHADIHRLQARRACAGMG